MQQAPSDSSTSNPIQNYQNVEHSSNEENYNGRLLPNSNESSRLQGVLSRTRGQSNGKRNEWAWTGQINHQEYVKLRISHAEVVLKTVVEKAKQWELRQSTGFR